jgi:hypothetical protein
MVRQVNRRNGTIQGRFLRAFEQEGLNKEVHQYGKDKFLIRRISGMSQIECIRHI